MLLRASSQTSDQSVDLRAIVDADAAADSGVPCGEELVAFAEAAFAGDDEVLCAARRELESAVGPAGLVDAAAVVGNFQRMVRIADATGIPLDDAMDRLTAELRADLGIDRFAGAAGKSGGRLRRALARGLRAVGLRSLRR